MHEYIYRMRNDGLHVLDIKKTDNKLRSAAKFIANYEPEDILAVSALLRHGASVNMISSDRRSALYIAREYKQKNVEKALLKAGADELDMPVPQGKREKKG